MTAEEFKAKATETIETCEKYGFMENKIMPYSFVMTVRELVKHWKDYDRCSRSSKHIMEAELKGFLPILEHWVKLENEPKVKVQMPNGRVKEVPKSVADDLIDLGAVAVA